MTITDAQIHVWEVDRPGRPWPQPPRNTPQREGGFSAVEALAAMDAIGVDRAVIVPPTWIGENNSTALEAAAAHPGRFGVMGRFDLTVPDRAERLRDWLQQPHMLGIRMTFIGAPPASVLDDGSLEWFWSACERHGIPLMLLLGNMPEKAAPIAERHPALTIVIDHMALNLTVPPGPASWESIDRTVALARFPKVHVKVSSAPNFSTEAYPHHDIEGYLRKLYDAYGARRLFWGADFTRLRGTYANCLRMFAEDLDFLSAEDRAWITGRGVSAALNWPEA